MSSLLNDLTVKKTALIGPIYQSDLMMEDKRDISDYGLRTCVYYAIFTYLFINLYHNNNTRLAS